MKLILMLQDSKKRVTVDKLAETFDVSRRTIFRDLNSLSELNVPVTWERYSGYGVMPGYKIPPLMFTSRELATIMVGLNFVKSQVDRQLVEDAKGVELKISHVLPDELRDFMESLGERTVVDPYFQFGTEKKEGGNWYLVSSAIAQNRSVSFSYQNKGDQSATRRNIDPYLLVFFHDHWNVIGYSHKRRDIRNFILDRMQEISISEENFVQNEKMDIEALIFRSDGSEHLVNVLVHTSVFKRFQAHLPTKIIKQEGLNTEKIKVSFKFDNLTYINEWLLRFGDKVEVMSPDSLISMRRELLERMITQSSE